MKTSKLRKLAWVFFALALGTTTVFAQGWKNGKNSNNNQNQACLNQISDLSEEQKTKIQEMESIHQKEMTVLRDERRSTVDAIEKNEIRGEMLKNVKSHQTAVRILLSEEQQNQYALLHARNQNSGNKNCTGMRSGNNNGAGKQQLAQGSRAECKGNQTGMEQGNQNNNRQNGCGCRGNNNRGNNGNGCGNGNRCNSSNS